MDNERGLLEIQTEERLNHAYSVGEVGPGGAYHDYVIRRADNGEVLAEIKYQKGPRKDPSSRHGVLENDLLEIVMDRLSAFQAGEFACTENEEALQHVHAALLALNKRVENRIARGVLGKNEK